MRTHLISASTEGRFRLTRSLCRWESVGNECSSTVKTRGRTDSARQSNLDTRKRKTRCRGLTDPGVERVGLGVHVDASRVLARLLSDQRLECQRERSGRSGSALAVERGQGGIGRSATH